MKKSIVILALVILSFAVAQNAMAQTAVQTLSLAVNTVQKIAVSGNPAAMTITDGTAGTDALTSVTNSATTYSMTQNSATPAKITAGLDVALGSGYSLTIELASTKGTSALAVDIAGGTTKDVVTAMAKGADAGQTITYVFGATATAGVLTTTTEHVTLTLTN